MSRVTSNTDLSASLSDDDFKKYCSRAIQDIVNTINGKIDFDINLSTQTLTASFSAANTDTVIQHKLGRTGLKYIVAQKGAACDVYDGAGKSTTNTIVLRATAATSVTLVLF